MIGPKVDINETRKGILTKFHCDDEEEMNEYVACKIERKEVLIELAQPVSVQSFEDEFKLPKATFQVTHTC